MMRILLLLTVLVTLGFGLFPDVADQPLRIEALGWVFETRQGAFVIAVLLLCLLILLLRWLLRWLGAGPGRIWQLFAISGRKREARRLQQALADLINQRQDLGRKALPRRCRTLPAWLGALVRVWATPIASLQAGDKPLCTALAARLATEPGARSIVSAEQRHHLLQAWLAAFPDAPLARMRMAELWEEQAKWQEAAESWEALLRDDLVAREQGVAHLVQCLERQAEQGDASVLLHHALKWQPARSDLVRRLGQAYLAEQQYDAARKLWWDHVLKHEDFEVAQSLLPLLREDALRHFKKLDQATRRHGTNRALLWLKAELAHTAGMDGIADELLHRLAEREGCPVAWLSLARLLVARGDYEQACRCYEQALDIARKIR
ncbi:MAG: tetratricopeptide repeat protein [Zetaproteobacteria bacterium]|nr:MAG: tetratricopeptide repeat protein [Zetaproteobacteria bacterium]